MGPSSWELPVKCSGGKHWFTSFRPFRFLSHFLVIFWLHRSTPKHGRSTAINIRSTPKNVRSTVCLRFVYGLLWTEIFTPKKKLLEKSHPLVFSFRSKGPYPLTEGLPQKSPIIGKLFCERIEKSNEIIYNCLWFVYGLSMVCTMVCLWFVYGLSMVFGFFLWFVYGFGCFRCSLATLNASPEQKGKGCVTFSP